MKSRNASSASFFGTKDWPLCEHIAVSWVWHFQMLTAWFLNPFCTANWGLHGHLHWSRECQQRAVCSERVSMGRLQKGNRISEKRAGFLLCCAAKFRSRGLQSTPVSTASQGLILCSSKFLLFFCFCKQGRIPEPRVSVFRTWSPS